MSSFASANLTAGQLNALVKKIGGERSVRGILDGTMKFQITEGPNPTPLEFLGTVTVPATTEGFVAKDHFKVDTGPEATVRISCVGDNFDNSIEGFLSGDGKIENPEGELTLCYHKLRQTLRDDQIIAELGGEEKSETTLFEIFSLMQKQANGEDGALLNNSYSNIFYIRDSSGVIRVVLVYWRDGGWGVGISTLGFRYGWSAGCRVFSRNSVIKSSKSVPAAS